MPNEHAVEVFVQLNYWDVYRSNVRLTARALRKVLWIFGIMGALWICLLVMAQLRPRPETDWQQMIHNDSALVIVFLVPLLIVFVAPLLGARRVLRDPRLIEGSHYRFSDGGIHVKSSVAEADIQWKAFREVVETRTAFLLFPASNLAHTLPLRCFGSGATIQAARGLFRANVPKARLHGQSN